MLNHRARHTGFASLWGSLALSVLALFLIVFIVVGTGPTPVSACDPQGPPCLVPFPAATEDTGGGGTGGETGGETDGGETGGSAETGLTDSSGPRNYGGVIMKGDICVTHGTRMAVEGTRLSVYSDFGPTTPNGMLITTLDLSTLPSVTEADKALETPVVLLVKNSEYAPGWSVTLYWYAEHYGVTVYHDGTLFDNTGPVCGWF